MTNDKTIKEQKVYVRLADVLELQDQYHQTMTYKDSVRDKADTIRVGAGARLETFERIIKMLGLPIHTR